jgi:CAAX protease family protein
VAEVPTNAEPPLVTRVVTPAEAPIPGRSRPGFREAVLWCLIFLALQIASALLGMATVLVFHAIQHDNPLQFFNDQLSGLAKATAPNTPAESRPSIPSEIGQSLAYGMLAAPVGSLGLILLVFPRRIGPDWKRQLGVRVPAGIHIFLVLLIVPGFMIVPGLVQEIYSRVTGFQPPATVQALKGVFQQIPLPLAVLAIGVGPGVCEELWCRGFIGRGLCGRHGIVAGVLLTSLLFAALHLDPSQLLAMAMMGAYLHFVYLATRSIWMPIMLHLLNNSLAVIAALSGVAEKLNALPQELSPVLFLAAFSLVLFGTIALWTSRARLEPIRDTEEDWWDAPGWKPEYPGVSTPPPSAAAEVWLAYAPASPVAVMFTMISCAVLVYLLAR